MRDDVCTVCFAEAKAWGHEIFRLGDACGGICETCALDRDLVPCVCGRDLMDRPRLYGQAALCAECAKRSEEHFGRKLSAAETAGVDWEELGIRPSTWRTGE